MELLTYWRVIRKSLWFILLIAVVSLGTTAYYTSKQPIQYQSSATLLLNPNVPSALVPFVQNQFAASLSDSYTELIHTQSFGETVVKQLPYPSSADDVAASLTTQLVPNTLFYRITAQQGSPERAQQLVATVLQVFLSANNAQQVQAQTSNQSTNTRSQMRQFLSDKLTYLSDQIKDYQDQIATLQAQPPSTDRNDQLTQLRSQLIMVQETQITVVTSLGQLADEGAAPPSAIVVDPPQPGRPIPSKLITNLELALVVSLLLGLGVAFLRDYLDDSIRSARQLGDAIGLVPVVSIGVVSPSRKQAHAYGRRPGGDTGSDSTDRGLVALECPRSPEAESFRLLRTHLQFASSEPVHRLLVTSVAPREGKSFISANLAVITAQAGKRVILVDADLRNPSQHKLFDLPNDTGFGNMLLNRSADLPGARCEIPNVPNLEVVPCGPLLPNPAELLDDTQTVPVLDRLAAQAEVIIYDSPPAGLVTDSLILAAHVDAVILVVGIGTTRKEQVEHIVQNLRSVGVKTVLPVLNWVKDDLGSLYYGYYSQSGNASQPSLNGSTPTSSTRAGLAEDHE